VIKKYKCSFSSQDNKSFEIQISYFIQTEIVIYLLLLSKFTATIRKPMEPALRQNLADFGQVIKQFIVFSHLINVITDLYF